MAVCVITAISSCRARQPTRASSPFPGGGKVVLSSCLDSFRRGKGSSSCLSCRCWDAHDLSWGPPKDQVPLTRQPTVTVPLLGTTTAWGSFAVDSGGVSRVSIAHFVLSGLLCPCSQQFSFPHCCQESWRTPSALCFVGQTIMEPD